MAKVELEIPFDLEAHDLKLESASRDPQSMEDLIQWLRVSALTEERFEEEMDRILTCTVLLRNANAGALAECFKTAVVWERG